MHFPARGCGGRQPRRSLPTAYAALGCYLAMLRANGRVPPRRPSGNAAIIGELADFDRYLTEVRGLALATRHRQLREARAFLIDFSTEGVVPLSRVQPREVADFLARQSVNWAPASTRVAGGALRSHFAFKAMSGARTVALMAAVPCVAPWHGKKLPPSLTTAEIAQLLAAFDRTSATGQRDYAITRCLVDLGLRRAEVARLRLRR